MTFAIDVHHHILPDFFFKGTDIHAPGHKLTHPRRHVGMVFQQFNLSGAKYRSGGDRCLKQPATVLFPTVGNELGRRGGGRARTLRRRITVK